MRVATLDDIGRLTDGIERDLRAGRLEAASAKLAELRALTTLLSPQPQREAASAADIALMRQVAPFLCDEATAAALDELLEGLEPNATADAADGCSTVEERASSRYRSADLIPLLGIIAAAMAVPLVPAEGEVH